MTLTKKEQSLLKDLQNGEKLCAEKYQRAAAQAEDPYLQSMFQEIGAAEENHYNTVTQMLGGIMPQAKTSSSKSEPQKTEQQLKSKASRSGKQKDAYLLGDLLATEKYIASTYNISVFEFSDEKARQVLSGIQQQEQHHGKQLSEYMQANNMFC